MTNLSKDKRMSMIKMNWQKFMFYIQLQCNVMYVQDSLRARQEIIFLFASLVAGVNRIYRNTVFQFDKFGPFTGINFVIHRAQVSLSETCCYIIFIHVRRIIIRVVSRRCVLIYYHIF